MAYKAESIVEEQGFEAAYDCLTRHHGLSDTQARVAIFEGTGVQIATSTYDSKSIETEKEC